MVMLEGELQVDTSQKPYVIMMVGVNGAGKTTTIGKLTKWLQAQGKTIMLSAADTFRAAAVEQLKVWGERNGVDVVGQPTGSDPAAVAYDALQAAKAKGHDVLIVDTAGRLHTQDNLMAELAKIKKVLGKLDANAPHEVLLVIDGSTGQNAILQAKHFHQAVGVNGVVITKLDGSAKGGAIVSLAESLPVKLRFVGVGEKVDDIEIFSAKEYAKALVISDNE
jgi:fused signal recognition particle receptor